MSDMVEKAWDMVGDLIESMKNHGKKGEWDIYIVNHFLGGNKNFPVPMEAVGIPIKHRGEEELSKKMLEKIYLYVTTYDFDDDDLITRGYMK